MLPILLMVVGAFFRVEELDSDLTRLCREDSALRLDIGTGLDRLFAINGHHDLGFSSLGSYVREQLDRSPRWGQEARLLVSRVAPLPKIRRALREGRLSWSMTSELARIATPEDEEEWIRHCEKSTVREMRTIAKMLHESSQHDREDESEARRAGQSAAESAPETPSSPGQVGEATSNRAGEASLNWAGEASTHQVGTASGNQAGQASSIQAGSTRTDEARVARTDRDNGSSAEDEERFQVLTVTVDRQDAWLYECARTIVGRLSGGRTTHDVIEALVGEGWSSLVENIPRGTKYPKIDEDTGATAQRAWEAELARYREQAEEMCEPRIQGQSVPDLDPLPEASFDGNAIAIDAELRRLASELARRDLSIGRVAEAFWKADGWRKLGYATETQYARERLGLSMTAIRAKRRLARKLGHLEDLEAAVENHRLGYEAARLVAEIATKETVGEWVERAEVRTLKMLREEIDGTGMLARITKNDSPPKPPSDAVMTALEELESRIVSGAAFANGSMSASEAATALLTSWHARQKSAPAAPSSDSSALASTDTWHAQQMSASAESEAANESGPLKTWSDTPVAANAERLWHAQQMSAPVEGSNGASAAAKTEPWHEQQMSAPLATGRITLRLQVRAETYRFYRWLERLYQRFRPTKAPFFQYLCTSLIDTWKYTLEPTVAYGDVYARDRFRCRCPVCTRSDWQPHHLKYRSRGGGEERENLASACGWCHLEGIHGGRLRAEPPASSITWFIGREPHTVVRGRERIRLSKMATVPGGQKERAFAMLAE